MYLVPPAHSLSLLFFFFFFFIFLLLLVHAIFHAPLLAVFADGLNDWLSAHLQQAIYEALQVLRLSLSEFTRRRLVQFNSISRNDHRRPESEWRLRSECSPCTTATRLSSLLATCSCL